MASIRMRDGKYQVNIRRRGYPTVTRTFTSRRAAKSWSKTTEIQMERGEFNPHSNITVEELIKKYVKEVLRNLEVATLQNTAVKHCDAFLESIE